METTQTPPAGWYTCPANATRLRYFDGLQWTDHTAPRQQYAAPAAPPYAQAPPTPGSGGHPRDAVHWLVPTGRTGSAIAAGYLGLFALGIWPLGPVAVGFGIWALRTTRASSRHGAGRAWFAIVAGVLATVGMLLLLLGGFFS